MVVVILWSRMFWRWSLLVCVMIPCLCQYKVCAKEVCKQNEAPNPWFRETVARAASPADITSFDSGIGQSVEGSASWNLWHQSWETVSYQTLDVSSLSLVHGINFDIIQHYQVSVSPGHDDWLLNLYRQTNTDLTLRFHKSV